MTIDESIEIKQKRNVKQPGTSNKNIWLFTLDNISFLFLAFPQKVK